MTELEDEVFVEASGIVSAALAFHEVSPEQRDPPPEWVQQLGEEAARRKLQLAKLMWMKRADMPGGVELASKLLVGIARGRGHRGKVTIRELNATINLPAPTSAGHPGGVVYPTKDIE